MPADIYETNPACSEMAIAFMSDMNDMCAMAKLETICALIGMVAAEIPDARRKQVMTNLALGIAGFARGS